MSIRVLCHFHIEFTTLTEELMNKVAKIVVSSVLSLIIGAAIGAAVTSHVIGRYLNTTLAYDIIHEYASSIESLAHGTTGDPRSLEEMHDGLVVVLSLNTINVAYMFDHIREPRARMEALRLTKLIDANPALQGPATSNTSRDAAAARHCILQGSADPPAVGKCIRSSMQDKSVVIAP